MQYTTELHNIKMMMATTVISIHCLFRYFNHANLWCIHHKSTDREER